MIQERLLRAGDIVGKNGQLGILPISKSTLWSWVARGVFPRPVKLGDRVTCWRETDVDDFIEKKWNKQ